MQKEITLKELGYDTFFESHRTEMGLDGFSIARVTSEHRGAYTIQNENGEFRAKVTGKRMFRAISKEEYPTVGDFVAITELGAGQAVIHAILPRKTVIKRIFGDKNKIGTKTETQVIGANIDTAFIVASVTRDYSLNRLERYIALVTDGGVEPLVILNKADVTLQEELDTKLKEIKSRFSDMEVILTSTVTGSGLDELRAKIVKGRTYCFLGSSGVGKSSLINKLRGDTTIKTGDISEGADRGKHVTTRRQMYFLENGGIVIDNPGMREVGTADAREGIAELFAEIEILAKRCKYTDCTHGSEPGCEVLATLHSGTLDADKYSNYLSLKKEADYAEMSEFEKKEKDREFGKFIKAAKKQFKRYDDL